MFDYSIEEQLEKIVDSRSKKYFKEVLQTYTNANLRSSVVMLWTVVVCDLVFKLKELQEIYGDPTAENILKEIEAKQSANPKSPDWETYLVEKVYERTSLLSISEYNEIIHVKEQRHLSAHPVLTHVDLLHEPTPESVRASIRSVLEGLLVKPPFLTKNVVGQLVVDIAEKKHLFPDDGSFMRYLNEKYYQRLAPESETYLFRELWKFVFKLEDAKTNENREINYRALKILFEKNREQFKGFIRSQPERFSELSFQEPIRYLYRLLCIDPSVYQCLSSSAKEPISNYSQATLDYFSISFFLHNSIEEHLDALLHKIEALTYINYTDGISIEHWVMLLEICHDKDVKDKIIEIAIVMYSKSMNYDTGDYFFIWYVQSLGGELSELQLTNLIQKTETNTQIHHRGRARVQHRELVARNIHVLNPSFVWSDYPNWESVK